MAPTNLAFSPARAGQARGEKLMTIEMEDHLDDHACDHVMFSDDGCSVGVPGFPGS